MKLKLSLVFVSLLLVFTGCIPSLERGEEEIIIVEETEETEEQQFILTPTIDTPENFYRNVLKDGSYYRSDTRGNVRHWMSNRIDINQFELGLMEIATTRFNQDQFYFREGDTLSAQRTMSWLRRYDRFSNTEGLNPELNNDDDDVVEITQGRKKFAELAYDELLERMRERPQVFAHMIEHQYFHVTDEERVELGGIVIGVALNSVYSFRLEDEQGRYTFYEQPISDEVLETQGREIAQEIALRFRNREGLEEVPITLALYREERRGAIVPGSFFAMTHLDEGESTIQNWEAINEAFHFFPSSQARREFPNESNNFNQFKTEVIEFFGRNIGVVGKGRYKNGDLEEMTIELNLQSHGKPEIIALTQYVRGKIGNLFSTQTPTYVYINSINGPESIIIHNPGQEPYIHIYK
ncbi:CamS family sex pheromone protein [Evansella sp. AB-rgal1]|uniref:CamS family sex pheromone protein n=1 Tax=Evansella sp. AB-rgal1 TaxID=3242696 RepID=UPI00359CC47A